MLDLVTWVDSFELIIEDCDIYSLNRLNCQPLNTRHQYWVDLLRSYYNPYVDTYRWKTHGYADGIEFARVSLSNVISKATQTKHDDHLLSAFRKLQADRAVNFKQYEIHVDQAVQSMDDRVILTKFQDPKISLKIKRILMKNSMLKVLYNIVGTVCEVSSQKSLLKPSFIQDFVCNQIPKTAVVPFFRDSCLAVLDCFPVHRHNLVSLRDNLATISISRLQESLAKNLRLPTFDPPLQ